MRFPLSALCVSLLLSACTGAEIKPEVSQEDLEKKVAPLVLEAQREYRGGRYSTALFHYEQVLDYTPNDETARLYVAHSHRQLGNHTLAREKYQALLAENGDNIDAREGYGLTLLKFGEHQLAREQFLAVLEKDARRWQSLNALGVIEDVAARYEIASDYYRRALSLDSDNTLIINNLGYSLIMAKRYADAEYELKRGLSLSPNFFRLRNNLAIAHAWQTEYRQAIDVLTPVLPHEVAYNNVGYIAMLSGDYAKARFYLKKAITTSPRFYVQAARNLERLEEEMRRRSENESLSGD